jgi:hypothetical protein
MNTHAPGSLRRLARESGYEDEQAMLRDKTFEEYAKELERESIPVEIVVSRERKLALSDLLEDTTRLAQEMGVEFKQTFLQLMKEYYKTHGRLGPKIQTYLQEKMLDRPRFAIYDHEKAKQLFEELGFTQESIEQNHLLLLFELPKPLAEFWWKNNNQPWAEGSQEIKGSAIEWGQFYEKLIKIIWRHLDRSNDQGSVYLDRINDQGHHEPHKFYYLWETLPTSDFN